MKNFADIATPNCNCWRACNHRAGIMVTPMVALTGKDVPFVWDPVCSTAFYNLRDSLIHTPILAFLTETGQYFLDASNFGFYVVS